MKKTCIIYAPIDTYSGYGSRARDVVKALVQLKGLEWDIRIISVPWGGTPTGFIQNHEGEWGWMREFIIPSQLKTQPDIFIMISVPNEMKPVGKYNIIITAGIETTLAPPEFIEGCNKADLILTSSYHSKKVLENTKYNKKLSDGSIEDLELKKPVKVLFEGADLNKYKIIDDWDDTFFDLSNIQENFCYLSVGHWLPGDVGHDRKNMGLLVKVFLETFKNKPNAPALILKTSVHNSSYIDRNEILHRIHNIKKEIIHNTLPNIYLVHGDLTEEEMNYLYNHPKVKAMVCPTKGEGFGRPLLEFSLINKPIISTKWSGQIDFLNSDFTYLIKGELENVHPSANQNKLLLLNSQWLKITESDLKKSLLDIHNNYKKWITNAKRQGHYSRENFSFEKMKEQIMDVLKNENMGAEFKPINI